MREEIVKQCLAGKPLFGKDGALAPMIQSILNAVLEGEMDAHLTEEERQSGNRRNGKMEKQVQTPYGEVSVSTPRDRNGTFDPQFIKKRETVLAEGSADKIIGLYALGACTSFCMFSAATLKTSNWLGRSFCAYKGNWRPCGWLFHKRSTSSRKGTTLY